MRSALRVPVNATKERIFGRGLIWPSPPPQPPTQKTKVTPTKHYWKTTQLLLWYQLQVLACRVLTVSKLCQVKETTFRNRMWVWALVRQICGQSRVPNSEISGAVYKINPALIPCIKACGILLQLFFLSTLMICLDPELSSVAYQ